MRIRGTIINWKCDVGKANKIEIQGIKNGDAEDSTNANAN
jgi:hypothetical protein